MEYKKITNVVFEGIDYNDAPDFVDAFVVGANYLGEVMTEKQLELLNENSDLTYDLLLNFIH